MANLPPPPPPPPPSGRGQGGSPTPPPNRRLPTNRPNPQGGGQGPGQNQGGKGPGLPRWSIWVLLGLLVLLLFGSRLIPTNNGKELSYGSYLSQVKAGDVAKSNYNNSSGRITGETDQRPEVHDLRPDARCPTPTRS